MAYQPIQEDPLLDQLKRIKGKVKVWDANDDADYPILVLNLRKSTVSSWNGENQGNLSLDYKKTNKNTVVFNSTLNMSDSGKKIRIIITLTNILDSSEQGELLAKGILDFGYNIKYKLEIDL